MCRGLRLPAGERASIGPGACQRRRKLERDLDTIMALSLVAENGRRLPKQYAKVRDHLFTFLDYPEIADDNSSERELRPTATYRKVTGGFPSD